MRLFVILLGFVLKILQQQVNSFSLSTCPACSDQSPVLRTDGVTVALHKVCCPDGTVWVRFGQGDQGATWTHFFEKALDVQYELLTADDIKTVQNLNYTGFVVESDVGFTIKQDNSYHPSYISLLYFEGKTTENLTLQENSCGEEYDFTHVGFPPDDHSRIQCDPYYPTNSRSMCGRNNMPGSQGTKGTSNQAAVTKIHFQPQGAGYCLYDYCGDGYDSSGSCDDRHRNAYSWRGSYYYVFLQISGLAVCDVEVSSRRQCLSPEVTQEQCTAHACCYDKASTLKCFHGNDKAAGYQRTLGGCVGTDITTSHSSFSTCKQTCSARIACHQMEYDFHGGGCTLRSDQCQTKTNQPVYTYDKVSIETSFRTSDLDLVYDGDYTTCLTVGKKGSVKLRLPYPKQSTTSVDFNITVTGKNLMTAEEQKIYVYVPNKDTTGASNFPGLFQVCTELSEATATDRMYFCACSQTLKCDAVYVQLVDSSTTGVDMELCDILVH